MQSLELASPAKINLFLDVIGRRSDGYHDIVTVFEKIDLCDRIEISESDEEIEVFSNNRQLPSGEKNLAFAASSLLKKTYGVSKGAKIFIEKNIPIASGLGGGSSNAAIVLKGLNRLWKLNLQERNLSELAGEIGTDVPFFIFNYSFALGSGKGERITPIKSDLEMWHLIISPPVEVLTRDVYDKLNLNLTEPASDVKIMVRAIEKKDFKSIRKHLYNKLEPVVTKEVKEITEIKKFVKKRGFDAVSLTGSGPAIYVLTNKKKEANGLKDGLLEFISKENYKGNWKLFVVKTGFRKFGRVSLNNSK